MSLETLICHCSRPLVLRRISLWYYQLADIAVPCVISHGSISISVGRSHGNLSVKPSGAERSTPGQWLINMSMGYRALMVASEW